MSGHGRLRELDSLRGIAAFAIVFFHYRSQFDASPLAGLLGPFYQFGFYAVDFFFVLSGFVLSRAYLNEARRYVLEENLVRRIARIYPLHLITLVAVAMGHILTATLSDETSPVFSEFNDGYHFVLNLLLSQFVGFQDGFSFNAPSWSISTEFYANVLFFAVLAFAGRGAIWIFVVLALASFLLLIGTQNGAIYRGSTIFFVQVSLIQTTFGFFLGVLLEQATRITSHRKPPPWLFDLSFIVVAALVFASAFGLLGRTRHFEYVLVMVLFPALIVSASGSGAVRWALHRRPLQWLGDVSYSLYLIHFPVQMLIASLALAGLIQIDYGRVSTLLTFLAISVTLAGLSYRYIELPLQRRINAAWRAQRGNPRTT